MVHTIILALLASICLSMHLLATELIGGGHSP